MVPSAAQSLDRIVREELHSGLAEDKLVTFASNLSLARRLAKKLGDRLGGETGTTGISLGVDMLAGVSRQTKNARPRQRKRLRNLIKRSRKLQCVRRSLPVRKIVCAKFITLVPCQLSNMVQQ